MKFLDKHLTLLAILFTFGYSGAQQSNDTLISQDGVLEIYFHYDTTTNSTQSIDIQYLPTRKRFSLNNWQAREQQCTPLFDLICEESIATLPFSIRISKIQKGIYCLYGSTVVHPFKVMHLWVVSRRKILRIAYFTFRDEYCTEWYFDSQKGETIIPSGTNNILEDRAYMLNPDNSFEIINKSKTVTHISCPIELPEPNSLPNESCFAIPFQ
jgi:hypothetical protein